MSTVTKTPTIYQYPGIASTPTSPSSSPASASGGGSVGFGSEGAPMPDPTPPAGMTWQSFQGEPPLFGSDGPEPSDVVQGSLNDCFLGSTLADLAKTDPDWIKQNIKQVGTPDNPEYQVQVFYQGTPETVTVDNKLLSHNGQQASMGASADGKQKSDALWPAIYEKAYAMVSGTDAGTTLNSGGFPSSAMKVFTGGGGTEVTMPSAGDFATQVQGGEYELSLDTLAGPSSIPGWNAGTQSASLDNGKYTVKATSANNLTVTDTTSNKTWQIAMPHSYSVQGVTSTNPNQSDPTKVSADDLSVNLYNPWGPSYTKQDGVSAMPYSLVQALFSVEGMGNRPVQLQAPAASA